MSKTPAPRNTPPLPPVPPAPVQTTIMTPAPSPGAAAAQDQIPASATPEPQVYDHTQDPALLHQRIRALEAALLAAQQAPALRLAIPLVPSAAMPSGIANRHNFRLLDQADERKLWSIFLHLDKTAACERDGTRITNPYQAFRWLLQQVEMKP